MQRGSPSSTLEVVVGVTASGTPVIALFGECDLASAEPFRDCLLDALQTNPREVILDLAGLEFIDSTGLNLMVQAHKQISEGGGRIALHNVPPAVAKVLAIAGIDVLFRHPEDTRSPALSLRERRPTE